MYHKQIRQQYAEQSVSQQNLYAIQPTTNLQLQGQTNPQLHYHSTQHLSQQQLQEEQQQQQQQQQQHNLQQPVTSQLQYSNQDYRQVCICDVIKYYWSTTLTFMIQICLFNLTLT